MLGRLAVNRRRQAFDASDVVQPRRRCRRRQTGIADASTSQNSTHLDNYLTLPQSRPGSQLPSTRRLPDKPLCNISRSLAPVLKQVTHCLLERYLGFPTGVLGELRGVRNL
jgi:hypothetical protein